MQTAVIGAGLVGLSAARAVAKRGEHITIIDDYRVAAASPMAGGMLAPISELWFGEEARLRLDIQSLRLWPTYARDLEQESGVDIDLRTHGTLQVSFDHDDLLELRRIHDLQINLGLETELLTSEEVLHLSPFLNPKITGGIHIKDDLAVDNRKLLKALYQALEISGATFINNSVTRMAKISEMFELELSSTKLRFDRVILATGAWTNELLDDFGPNPQIRPINGEILRLSSKTRVLDHTIRANVRGSAVYIVPRSNFDDSPTHELVVGATQNERGFESLPQAGGIYQLLRDSREILPHILEMNLVEVGMGLRPGSRNNTPIIDRHPNHPELIIATGHYRNGVLLTPLTELTLSQILDGHSTHTSLAWNL